MGGEKCLMMAEVGSNDLAVEIRGMWDGVRKKGSTVEATRLVEARSFITTCMRTYM